MILPCNLIGFFSVRGKGFSFLRTFYAHGLTLLSMAEEIHSDSFPDLNELENKIGRKTPDSLLVWMREDCEQGWRSDHLAKGSDSTLCHDLTEKITNLKQELVKKSSFAFHFFDIRMPLCDAVTPPVDTFELPWLAEPVDANIAVFVLKCQTHRAPF